MNRPARFTVLDLLRATKAAQKAGPEWAVDVLPDGTIRLIRKPPSPITAPLPVEDQEGVRLF